MVCSCQTLMHCFQTFFLFLFLSLKKKRCHSHLLIYFVYSHSDVQSKKTRLVQTSFKECTRQFGWRMLKGPGLKFSSLYILPRKGAFSMFENITDICRTQEIRPGPFSICHLAWVYLNNRNIRMSYLELVTVIPLRAKRVESQQIFHLYVISVKETFADHSGWVNGSRGQIGRMQV